MRKGLSSLLLAASLLTGCATEEGRRLARQPPLPPAFVAKADAYRGFYHNVTIEEVFGTPEFALFGGGSLISTRPTRAQVLNVLQDDLARTDMLAPSRQSGEYMLYVKFEDLHGPDVWLFSDKQASAKVSFRLVRWRTGELIKRADIAVAYQAQFNGITLHDPEITREVVSAPAGSATWSDRVTLYTYGAGSSDALVTDAQPMLQAAEPLSVSSEIGSLNGTERRWAAVQGMLSLAFDEFVDQLSKDGVVTYKRAVACTDLNPSYFSYHSTVVQLETAQAYAVDCPGAYYKVSRLKALYPSQF